MGRLSNAIGIRLGNKIAWINNGIYIKKIKCIQYINFINNIVILISIGKVQKKDYLLSKIQLLQEKNSLLVNIYFYRKDINLFSIKKFKFINKFKKSKKIFNIKKINNIKIIKALRKKKKKINYLKKQNKKIKYFKRKIKKKIFERKNLKFFKRTWKRKSTSLMYILRKKIFKYYIKNRLLKFKINKEKKRDVFIYNNIFNEINLKKKKIINYNFIVIFKKNIKNILYNFLKKKLNILKKNNIKIYKKKKLVKINRLLNRNLNKSKKIKKLKKLLLKLVIRFNNKIDLLKINKIMMYKGLNNYLIPLRSIMIKKKLALLYLRKKKKKILKLLKFLTLRKLIKNNIIKNTYKKKYINLYSYCIKYININGKYYRKIYKYTFKEIIYYKINNYSELKKKESRKLYFLFKKIFLMSLLRTEKLILLVAKNYLNHDIIFNYFLVGNYNYTAELLTKYIAIKLKQKFTLNQVMKPLTRYLKKLIKKKNLFGYRVNLSGRFTRKQRATFIVIKFGTVPLATISNQIDYYQQNVVLKDGVGNVKVWLNKTKKFKNSLVGFKSI